MRRAVGQRHALPTGGAWRRPTTGLRIATPPAYAGLNGLRPGGAGDSPARTLDPHDFGQANRLPHPKAVFFDRDGTLMEEVNYCSDPSQVRVYAGVPAALKDLKQAGYWTFIITNQSGIGRGWFTEAQYRMVEAEFLRQVGEGLIDATYFCPDLPGVASARRKPEPGMVLEAAMDYGVDLKRSFVIGDKSVDVECGKRAGARTILVLTGYGREQDCNPDWIVEDAAEAVKLILRMRLP